MTTKEESVEIKAEKLETKNTTKGEERGLGDWLIIIGAVLAVAGKLLNFS